jgi:hypothetical protein
LLCNYKKWLEDYYTIIQPDIKIKQAKAYASAKITPRLLFANEAQALYN